jgi:hypothetical protein
VTRRDVLEDRTHVVVQLWVVRQRVEEVLDARLGVHLGQRVLPVIDVADAELPELGLDDREEVVERVGRGVVADLPQRVREPHQVGQERPRDGHPLIVGRDRLGHLLRYLLTPRPQLVVQLRTQLEVRAGVECGGPYRQHVLTTGQDHGDVLEVLQRAPLLLAQHEAVRHRERPLLRGGPAGEHERLDLCVGVTPVSLLFGTHG